MAPAFAICCQTHDGPGGLLLLGWMLVPLVMTLYFSFKKYCCFAAATRMGPA